MKNFFVSLNMRNRIAWVQVVIFITGLTAAVAHAEYFEADLSSPLADPKKGTHVIVAGRGGDVGESWLQAAHTQALKFRDRPGMGKVKLIAAIENPNYLNVLSMWGYENVQSFNISLDPQQLVERLSLLNIIESIDFIGHNSAYRGFVLDSRDPNQMLSSQEAHRFWGLRGKFSADAVIRIMGCNTGYTVAPSISSWTGVPTAGSFTSADTQEMHELNDWFYNDTGRYPPGIFILKNFVTFNSEMNCINKGGCTRLKVVSSAYKGGNGQYSTTLPFMKYFCWNNTADDCALRIAKSTTTLLSIKAVSELKPSPQDYALIVAEQFCPSSIDFVLRDDCRKRVMDHLLGVAALPPFFTSAVDDPLRCDFKSCSFTSFCNQGLCIPYTPYSGPNDTFTKELEAYKHGYEIWK